MRLRVEGWPSGGYVVRAAGSPTPLSRHDTEEEASEQLARYERGLARAAGEGERVTLRDVLTTDVELPVGGAGMRAALRSAATGHVGPPPVGARD